MANAGFLLSRLSGERFKDGEIPLAILSNLAILRNMIPEVAKWIFIKENPGCPHFPDDFTRAFDLKLATVKKGSSTAFITLVPRHTQSAPVESLKVYRHYYERALDSIVEGVRHIDSTDESLVNGYIPVECLGYLIRISQGLHDNDCLEIGSPCRQPARLTKQLRVSLQRRLSAARIIQKVHLRGIVPEADQNKMTFQLQQVYGGKVTCPMQEQHRETIIKAFEGYKDDTRILVQGTGFYHKQNHLDNLKSVTHVRLLNNLDVPARLDELRHMEHGWLEGSGSAPPHDGLDWLADIFQRSYPDDAPLPHTYPTPDGGIQMEWSYADNRATLEINLQNRIGEWLFFNRRSDGEDEKSLDLNSPDHWRWFIAKIRDKVVKSHE